MSSTRWLAIPAVAFSLVRPALAAPSEPVILVPEMRQAIGDGSMLRALADHGSPAQATVLELWESGASFLLWDNAHRCYVSTQPVGMRLEVVPADPAIAAFTAAVTAHVPRIDLPRYQPAQQIPVVFNPARPLELVTADDLRHVTPYLATSGGNPYHDTYRPARLRASAASAADAPALYEGGDPLTDGRILERLGYIELGRAQFEGIVTTAPHLVAVSADRAKARDQGRTVGAALAVLYGTTVGPSPVAPLRQLPGFEAPTQPATTESPERLAIYWAKVQADPLGVRFVVVGDSFARGTDEEGLLVEAVIKGSPAAAGGIREGDTLLALEGRPVGNGDTLPTLLARTVGRPSRIDLQRGSQRISVVVTPGTATP
jgi:hypothetical protein